MISPTACSLDISTWGRGGLIEVFVAAASAAWGLINTDKVVSGSTFSSLAALDGGPWAEEPWGLQKMPS